MNQKLWRLKWRDADKEKPKIDEGDMTSAEVLIITEGGQGAKLYGVGRWFGGFVGGEGYWLIRRDLKVLKWAHLPCQWTQKEYLELYEQGA